MIRSGKICISFLYRYLTVEKEKSDMKGGELLLKKYDKIECLKDTFTSFGGILAKISQMLCLDDESNDAFSDCKPFCQKETIESFKKFYSENKNTFFKDISNIDFNVYKSGSVGQLHRAILNNDKEIVIKVQYFNLKKQFDSDIFVLDKISNFLFNFTELKDALVDVKLKLYEELDYNLELYNHLQIYNLWKDDEFIKIPTIYPELSNDKILTMNFIEAENFKQFLE